MDCILIFEMKPLGIIRNKKNLEVYKIMHVDPREWRQKQSVPKPYFSW